jgi:hypothetical protein
MPIPAPSPQRCLPTSEGAHTMNDVICILAMIGLVAATLAYARLCDNA